MTIEPIIDQDTAAQLSNWALETGLWDGRSIDPNQLNDFKDTLIQNIALELFSKDPESFAFQKMSAELAYIGALEGEEEDILEELASLQALQNGIVIQAGCLKSLKKFWKKHKVEILIGIAAVAVVTAVAVSVICAAGVAAGVLATEGDKDKQEPPKPQPQASPPETAQASPEAFTWPKTDLVLEQDAVFFNGKSLSYTEALQTKTVAQTIYAQGEDSGLWKVYHQFTQNDGVPSARVEAPISDLPQNITQSFDTRNIPVFLRKIILL